MSLRFGRKAHGDCVSQQLACKTPPTRPEAGSPELESRDSLGARRRPDRTVRALGFVGEMIARCLTRSSSRGRGFIGSHLCESLLGMDFRLVGNRLVQRELRRSNQRANIAAASRNSRFELVEDRSTTWTWRASFRDGVVFHLAAQAGVRTAGRRGLTSISTRTFAATQKLCEACRAGRWRGSCTRARAPSTATPPSSP